MRKRKKTRRLRTAVTTDVFAEFARTQNDLLAAIDDVHARIVADKAANERRFSEIGASIDSLDPDENRLYREWSVRQTALFDVYLEEFAQRIAEIDSLEPSSTVATADLISVNDRLDAAVGEAMTVRIELDRLAERMQQRIDELTVRLAEAESRLADHGSDVALASQAERLDEIERAVEHLSGSSGHDIDARASDGLGDLGPDQGSTSGQACERSTGADDTGDPLARLALSLADADRADLTGPREGAR